jgi:hypothetical protein
VEAVVGLNGSADRDRVPAGVSAGGQFAAQGRAEADVHLQPIARSADRTDADSWQWPASVPRREAVTAYDDEAGWATIGDELTVRWDPASASGEWVDAARRDLAALMHAGLTGVAHVDVRRTCRVWDERRWTATFELPGGGDIRVDCEGPVLEREPASWFAFSTVGAVTHGCDSSRREDVDAAVERAVRARALSNDLASKLAVSPSRVQVSTPADVGLETTWFQVRVTPWGPTVPDTVVRVRDGVVLDVFEQGSGVPWQRADDQDAAFGRLGRRLGLRGGRRAGVPSSVRRAFEDAARGDGSPAVTWLLANRARLAGG